MSGCMALLLASAAACLAGALLVTFRIPVLKAAGDFLVVQEELRRADLILVSAGPDQRARYATQLYNQGLGNKIFFTGGRCQAQASPEEGRCAALAEREGIPKKDILVDEVEVTSTYDEALRLKAFIDSSSEPVHSVIVVSDPHHTRRARWTYRRVLGDGIFIQAAPVPFEQGPYRRDWWREEVSRSFVISEYLKFLYYLFRYSL
jgi:uncharacterized SAM-binding protein YcdF (DUF218 family)